MKSITIFLVLLFLPDNLAQMNPVKKITDYEFDSRNPFILSSGAWDVEGELFFEGIQDSSVNIFSLKYNPRADSFYQLSQIADNNYINRKLTGTYVYSYPSHDYKIILLQNYPNPFNPSTKIHYAAGSRQFVTLKVYDILGKEIASLVNDEKQSVEYEVEFNASFISSGFISTS